MKLLERWVAEKAGGLIVVAGPVFTPQWSSRKRGDPRIDALKALYPVVFYYQGSATLSLGRFGRSFSRAFFLAQPPVLLLQRRHARQQSGDQPLQPVGRQGVQVGQGWRGHAPNGSRPCSARKPPEHHAAPTARPF